MVFEASLVDVGIALLLAVALAQYAKFRDKAEKGFNWLAASGVFLIFAGLMPVTSTLSGFVTSGIWNGVGSVFEIIGWVFALVGTIFVGYESLVEK